MLESMLQQKKTDSPSVLRCKAHIAAIQAGAPSYLWDKALHPVESFDQSWRNLALSARWGHRIEARF